MGRKVVIDENVQELFRTIMRNCRRERKAARGPTLRELSATLGATENYLSAVESGREMPSFGLFLKYLIELRFDATTLEQIKITSHSREVSAAETDLRREIIQMAYEFPETQLRLLVEQARIVGRYGKSLKRGATTPPRRKR